MQVAADPEHGWRLEGVFEVTAGARAGGPGPRGHGQVAGGRYVYVTPAGFAAWPGPAGRGSKRSPRSVKPSGLSLRSRTGPKAGGVPGRSHYAVAGAATSNTTPNRGRCRTRGVAQARLAQPAENVNVFQVSHLFENYGGFDRRELLIC